MNGIEKNQLFNRVQPLKSKSSYFQKNNKSFDKVMKDSQSLQTVQPNENNRKLVKDIEENSDIKKLEKLIEDTLEKIEDSSDSDKETLNGMVDLLTLLQSMIQKHLESSIQDPSNSNNSNDTTFNLSDGILLTDSKSFMNAILSTTDSKKSTELNDLNGISTILSSILSKLIETIHSEAKLSDHLQNSNIEVSQSELKKLMAGLGAFLEDNGLDTDQIKIFSDSIVKMISNSKVVDSRANLEKQAISHTAEVEIDSVSVTKISTSETDNQNFSSSNQSFFGENVKQFALFIGKTTNKAEANQFVRDFQNIIQKSNFTNENGQQKIFIKLFPEQLGRISIELVKNEHGMTATIIASTAKAKELLQSNMDGLKQALQMNNLQVEKIDLYQSLQTDNASYLNRERDQKQQNQQQKQSNQPEKEEEVGSSFLDEFLKVSL
ncbi:flagellar hook-length control protein FliK [Bacillus sp. OAE603]|uniref:flagellar hook-length control protein FliK n=1 Tax=Gottfriedia sp. OAE603 TaxID=2663872 RepID=UPI00178A6884